MYRWGCVPQMTHSSPRAWIETLELSNKNEILNWYDQYSQANQYAESIEELSSGSDSLRSAPLPAEHTDQAGESTALGVTAETNRDLIPSVFANQRRINLLSWTLGLGTVRCIITAYSKVLLA